MLPSSPSHPQSPAGLHASAQAAVWQCARPVKGGRGGRSGAPLKRYDKIARRFFFEISMAAACDQERAARLSRHGRSGRSRGRVSDRKRQPASMRRPAWGTHQPSRLGPRRRQRARRAGVPHSSSRHREGACSRELTPVAAAASECSAWCAALGFRALGVAATARLARELQGLASTSEFSRGCGGEYLRPKKRSYGSDCPTLNSLERAFHHAVHATDRSRSARVLRGCVFRHTPPRGQRRRSRAASAKASRTAAEVLGRVLP